MKTTHRQLLAHNIDLLQDRLDGLDIKSEEEVSSPDDKIPFVVCQILRILDERLAEIESKLEIDS